MNIEGAERLAVKGMSEVFSQISALCISCHDFLADLGQSDDFGTKLEVVPRLKKSGIASLNILLTRKAGFVDSPMLLSNLK